MNRFNDNLGDDLSDILGLPAPTPTVDPNPTEFPAEPEVERPVLHLPQAPSQFTITCDDCRGSGDFRSYAGRVVGPCFRCKGTGKISPRQVGARKAQKTRETNKAAKLEAFKTENAAVYGWLTRNAPTFEFAASLLRSLNDWGSLTEKQLETAQRLAERERTRNAERAQRRAEQAPGPTLTRIDPNSDIPF